MTSRPGRRGAKLGAETAIEYTRQRPETILSGLGGAFDLIGGEALERAFAIVRPGAMVASIAGMPKPLTATTDLERGFGLRALFWVASFRYVVRLGGTG